QPAGAPFPTLYVALAGDPVEPPRAAPPPPPPPPKPAKCSKRTPPPVPLPGPADDAFVARYETLWWFDGTNTWHGTRLHSQATGTRAPVYAVAVDDVDPSIVYAATAAGVWKGKLTINAGTPSWNWAPFVNGLPEASVHDLSIF